LPYICSSDENRLFFLYLFFSSSLFLYMYFYYVAVLVVLVSKILFQELDWGLCFDKSGFINKFINQFYKSGLFLIKKRPLLPYRFLPTLKQ